MKPIQTPLATNTIAEARKASTNFPLKRPSRGPPVAMGLATPFFRILVRPRAAEMMEIAYVVKNSISAAYSPVRMVESGLNIILPRLLPSGLPVTNNIKFLSNIVFRFLPDDPQIIVMIKTDGTDSRQDSSRPTF